VAKSSFRQLFTNRIDGPWATSASSTVAQGCVDGVRVNVGTADAPERYGFWRALGLKQLFTTGSAVTLAAAQR
jgi:hypothetical protein